MEELSQPIKNLVITDGVFKDHPNDPEIRIYCKRVQTFLERVNAMMILELSDPYNWKVWKDVLNESQSLQSEGNTLYFEKLRKGKTSSPRESLNFLVEEEQKSERAEIVKHLTKPFYGLTPE